ncbi:hypothetical protein UA45_22555, partial [Morganella morganii]
TDEQTARVMLTLLRPGGVNQKQDATIMRSGYISSGEQLMLARRGAVGDILGYFIGREGELTEDVEMHRELIGHHPRRTENIPTVVGVAGGEEKAEVIVGGTAGGYINSLVTDEQTARVMLTLLT